MGSRFDPEQQRLRRRERNAKACRHHQSVLDDRCKAGVNPADAAVAVDGGVLVYPCLGRDDEAKGACPRFEANTPADCDALEAQHELELERLRKGTSWCCDAPYKPEYINAKNHGPRICSACGRLNFWV